VQTPQPGGQTSGSSSVAQSNSSTATDNAAATPETESSEATATAETSEPAPAAVAPIPQALPAPGPIPTVDATGPIPSAEPQTAAATSRSDPATIHTLVGILELGERSAALFEVNGVARRIYVGENIAGSGWTLVEVANQEAVMRRNGEVRTIFVGQQF
jgi:hypothetical protein